MHTRWESGYCHPEGRQKGCTDTVAQFTTCTVLSSSFPSVVAVLALFDLERLLADNEQVELLREVRDLLRVIAEPALAKRDERLRIALTSIVGKSKQKAKAVLLMDGLRSQLAIREATGMDSGNLSRLAKELRSKELIGADDKPKLVISIPPNFFENSEKHG